jgi:two-component system sensor kinase FixL
VESELNSLVEEVVELCRFEAQRDEIQITLRLTKDKTIVLADPIQIQQVLVNLLQNAIQALRGSPRDKRRIDIHTKVVEAAVLVSVNDSGPGLQLDPDLLFMPFTTNKPDGLGIGLSICRSIVEAHHGRIWADDAVACGMKIYVSLPRITQRNASRSEELDCVCR